MDNLRPGQFKIGNLLMGANSPIRISKFDVQSYDFNANDYQMPQQDEQRFTQDYLVAAPIVITGAILNNWRLKNIAGMTGLIPGHISNGMDLLQELQREWRADEVRKIWNAHKPLIQCTEEGTFRYYGRPRKFTYDKGGRKSTWTDFIAEFVRADTLAYSNEEYALEVSPSSAGTTTATAVRQAGMAATWIRFLIVGPITNPVIKFGPHTLTLNTTLAAGKIIEISAYPWDRRIVNSDGLNLSASLAATSPYLDELVFPANASYAVGLSGSSTTTATRLFPLWRDAEHII